MRQHHQRAMEGSYLHRWTIPHAGQKRTSRARVSTWSHPLRLQTLHANITATSAGGGTWPHAKAALALGTDSCSWRDAAYSSSPCSRACSPGTTPAAWRRLAESGTADARHIRSAGMFCMLRSLPRNADDAWLELQPPPPLATGAAASEWGVGEPITRAWPAGLTTISTGRSEGSLSSHDSAFGELSLG
jgi:hypothetical protein